MANDLNWGRHREKHFRQLALCLLASGQGRQLEELLVRKPDQPQNRFLMALKLAEEDRVAEALNELEPLANDPDQEEARHLAFKLLLHQARHYFYREELDELFSTLDQALKFMSANARVEKDLNGFQGILPLCFLRLGKRQKAEELWRQELWQSWQDSLHKLAMLSYHAARDSEERLIGQGTGDPELMDLWAKTIAFWIAYVNLDEFWQAWAQRRAACYGADIASEDLADLRKHLVEEHLQGLLHRFLDEHQQAGHGAEADRLRSSLTNLRLERRAANLWKKLIPNLAGLNERLNLDLGKPVALGNLVSAFQACQGEVVCFASDAPQEGCPRCTWETLCNSADPGPGALLQISSLGGPLLSAQVGLTGVTRQILSLYQELHPEDDAAETLATYFSPVGIALTWLEEQNPEQALLELERLDVDLRQSPQARYTLAAVLLARGSRLLGTHGIDAALTDWQRAHRLLGELHHQANRAAFRSRLQRLSDELSQTVGEGCLKEVRALKGQERLAEAIALATRGLAISQLPDLKDQLADLNCDQGGKFLREKNYGQARDFFQKALDLNANFHRAKEGISTAYNNEGVDEIDAGRLDKAITLMERALDYNPSNHVAKKNLAGVYHEKAVKKFKEHEYAHNNAAKRNIFMAAQELLKKAHEYDPSNDQVVKDHNTLLNIMRNF
jgi:tetratricopeptide (TPR) repeat protein